MPVRMASRTMSRSVQLPFMGLHRCEGLEDAVHSAAAAAKPGQVVLLSPACASFDSFENFERRGERFREIVEGLA